ncbi:ATP-binding protein [Streptosporangium sp. NBC_01495]|uniref:ATP-binding protein n=1 Tax=Streptosporangium sp. NBC_01495 TaxID=2903899 RepID=UPI002E30A78D|nr:ATP-binding protein [Streptosporangium sp. NBC_01495]
MGLGGGRQRGRHDRVGGDRVRSERETTGKEDSCPGHHGDGTSTTPWADRPHSAWRKVFPGRVESVPEARAWARDLLAGRVEVSVLDDVLLLLSELATNAVAHSDSGRAADGRMTVYVARLPGAVHVEVTDDGSEASAPAVRVPEADDDGGRGLWLVAMVAAGWGSHRDDAGGSVWFRVAD